MAGLGEQSRREESGAELDVVLSVGAVGAIVTLVLCLGWSDRYPFSTHDDFGHLTMLGFIARDQRPA